MPSARVYLDTTIFIEALDGQAAKAEKLKVLREICRKCPGQAVTSELVLAEAMGRESSRVGWAAQSRFYLNLVVWGRFIHLVPVSRDVLWETGPLRRTVKATGRSLKLADAIHVATAMMTACTSLVSSDTRLALPSSVTRIDPHAILPSDFEARLRA